jgi:lipopolysaccharide transport system ATP-binding protein
MDKNIAIEFQNVGKLYRLGLVGTGSLQHDINRWWQTSVLRREDPYLKIGEVNDRSSKGNSDYVWALKDISFKVEQGDVVGIIGKNGAGKSTLLKLLSHITAPSTGDIWYRGRIASLLEVGTGFHPEMTARQNIYMNGSIMGMTRHEIDRKLDEIVDFAGIERYLDTPVKRFSSGMTVRLGFAVAAFLEPEILVVDEVLAVGDAEFQKKAIGKMQDVSQDGGRTVLFVSHNMAAVKKLCKNGILLENGTLRYSGPVLDVVREYIGGGVKTTNKVEFPDLSTAPGNEKIKIRSFELTPIHGNQISVTSGIHVKFIFRNYQPNIMLDASCDLCSVDDTVICHIPALITPNKDAKAGDYCLEYDLPPFFLNLGRFYFRYWFGKDQHYRIWGEFVHSFEIENEITREGCMSTPRGLLRPKFDFRSYFIEPNPSCESH